MKLTQRDIQYIMNEARNIVAEKRGMVKENVAVDSVKVATTAEAGAEMKNGEHLINMAKKAASKVSNAAKNVANKFGAKKESQPKQSSGYSPKPHPTQSEE